MELNEKLIELVRKYKCLYDLKEKYYRNTAYKVRIWVKIAQEMNMTNNAVKHKWKILRDGYVKYKKQLAGQTGSERKNITYIWSEQLSFLDDTIQPRSSKNNFIPLTVDDPQNNETQQSNYSGSENTVIDQALHSDNGNDTENPTTSSCTPSALTLMSSQELENPNPPALSPAQGLQAKTRSCRKTETDIDKALKYLQSKNRPIHDSIDLLFLSYASTFKTLSRRKQFELKVKLATIFAEAELSEIEETPVSSRAYSFVSHGSSRKLPPQELTSYRNDSQNLSAATQQDLLTCSSDQYNFHDAPHIMSDPKAIVVKSISLKNEDNVYFNDQKEGVSCEEQKSDNSDETDPMLIKQEPDVSSKEQISENIDETIVVATIKREPVELSDGEGSNSCLQWLCKTELGVSSEEQKTEISDETVVVATVKQEPVELSEGERSDSCLQWLPSLCKTEFGVSSEEQTWDNSNGTVVANINQEQDLCSVKDHNDDSFTFFKGELDHKATKIFQSNPRTSIKGKNHFSFNQCFKQFSHKKNLEKQMLIHSGEKPFSCQQCFKQFTQKSSLNQHMLIHSGEKRFSCSQCSKKFAYKSNLKVHMLIHSGEKPFSCQQCFKQFTQKCSLKQHMLLHSGQKPFSCQQCVKQYALERSLKKHMLIHSGEKAFSCHQCSQQFTYKSSLQKHMSTNCGDKAFSCDKCCRRFTQQETLMKHMFIHSMEKFFKH